MIIRILEYTSWQNPTPLNEINLAFVGDDHDLYAELKSVSAQLKVNNKPLNVVKSDIDSIDPQKFQAVYLSKQANAQISPLANRIRRTDTLLISDMAPSRHDVMVNFLEVSSNVIDFEINRSNIVFEQLKINRDLLLLGGTEIDVAELFRETESSLQQIKQNLFEKEAKLKQTSAQLSKEQQQIKQQHQQLTQQHQQIQTFKQELTQQQLQLQQRSQQLDKLNADVRLVTQTLETKQQELQQQEEHNTEQLKLIRDQGVKVAFLNEQIYEKQAYLAAREEQLESLKGENTEQQGTLLSQKRTLASAFFALFLLLGLIIYGSNVIRTRRQAISLLRQTQNNLVTLSGIGRKLTANLDLNSVLEQVYQSLNEVLDAHIFLLGVTDREHNRINVPLLVEKKRKLAPISFDLNDHTKPAVWCIQHQRELVINNEEQWLAHFNQPMPTPAKGEKMITVVYQPLIIGQKIVGCISLQSPEPNAYDEQQLGMIRTLSRYVAIAVANAMGFTELEQQKQKTEQKNKELIITQQQLLASQKMASLGMLTSSVAEQISGPINTALNANNEISAALSAELQQLEATNQAESSQWHQLLSKLNKLNLTAEHGSKQIKSLIDNIYSFDHQNHQEIQQTPLNQQLSSTIQTLKSRYQNIEFELTPSLKYCKLIYPEKLSQALLNLLINACQAITNKQATDSREFKGVVKLDGVEEDHQYVLTIADNGCGMTGTVQQQILRPFYSTGDDDIGLGLTISLDIVTDLAGQLRIESEPNNGTLITINLPLP